MRKTFILSSLFIAAFFLSGCGSGSTTTNTTSTTEAVAITNATVIKSEDGGTTWNPKIKIDDKKTIVGINVLSMVINPYDSNIIYIGTEANGLFMTKDAGETWTQVPFANKVYGLAFDPQNPNIMYGSGIFNKRAKIFKRIQEDQEWKEIYTEPSDGTTISSLAINKMNSQIIYAGTSAGVIVKSIDGGQTWASLTKEKGPIISIVFDVADSSHVFFGIFQKGVIETKNGGKNTSDDDIKIINQSGNISSLYTLVSDPYLSGVVYAGTKNGIFRRSADGKWSELNIIESSRAFPIRAIAINPQNSKEIIYSSAKAIYKSIDSGLTWSTFQLDTTKEISVLNYDSTNTAKIYAGLRSF